MRKSAFLLLWSVLGFHSGLASEIPESLHISNGDTPYPGWVIAEKVLTSSGEVDPALFTPADRSIISGYLKLPPRDGCIRLGQEQKTEETRVGTQKDLRQDLDNTARHAGWVFSASVVAKATGFSGSTPGTLLEVLPEETFKGPRERGGAHYVFIPIGTISMGGKKICKIDERYPPLPEVGEQVILLVDLFWRNQGRFLSATADSGIVTISANGRIHLPRRFHSTEAWLSNSEVSDLMGFIRKATMEFT